MDPTSIPLERMYSDLAYLWPLISPPEDYAQEAQGFVNALRGKLGPGRHEILELGVGGGHNLSHLTSRFKATAVDLSEGMLRHSIRLNPDVEHHVGDMRTIRLGKKFKAVLIHDATELTFILYEHDPDPADTTTESIMFYLIRENGRLRIEQDRHVTGLFPLQRWLDLMDEAGFEAEQYPCEYGDDTRPSILLLGTLRK